MIIHVVNTSEVHKTTVAGIKKHLLSAKGPLKFKFDTIPFLKLRKSRPLTFDELFHTASEYRRRNTYVSEADFVLILTDQANAQEYFALVDPKNLRDGFVHTDEWNLYIDCNKSIPAAFTVLNIVLLGMMSGSKEDLMNLTHKQSIGCLNDFCDEKREVALKLRTADICDVCLKRMLKARISPLSIDQSLRMLKSMRDMMIHVNHFHKKIKPSRLNVLVGKENALELLDYDNTKIALTELQMAMYLLFLLNPEGVKMSELEDRRYELRQYYMAAKEKSKKDYENALREDVKLSMSGRTDVFLEPELLKVIRRLRQDGVKMDKAFFALPDVSMAMKRVITARRKKYYEEIDSVIKNATDRNHSMKSAHKGDINSAINLEIGEVFSKPYLIQGERNQPRTIGCNRKLVVNLRELIKLKDEA
jgi:hypothetical protein